MSALENATGNGFISKVKGNIGITGDSPNLHLQI